MKLGFAPGQSSGRACTLHPEGRPCLGCQGGWSSNRGRQVGVWKEDCPGSPGRVRSWLQPTALREGQLAHPSHLRVPVSSLGPDDPPSPYWQPPMRGEELKGQQGLVAPCCPVLGGWGGNQCGITGAGRPLLEKSRQPPCGDQGDQGRGGGWEGCATTVLWTELPRHQLVAGSGAGVSQAFWTGHCWAECPSTLLGTRPGLHPLLLPGAPGTRLSQEG